MPPTHAVLRCAWRASGGFPALAPDTMLWHLLCSSAIPRRPRPFSQFSLLSDALASAGQIEALTPLEQALVLALATLEQRGGAHAPEAADWLLAPYVDALLMQPHTRHAVAVCTLLMRARHELRRARVRERGLLTLQAMHDHLQVPPLGLPAPVDAPVPRPDNASTCTPV